MVTVFIPASMPENNYARVSEDSVRLFNVKEGVNWSVQFGKDLPHQIKPGTWFLVNKDESYSLIPGSDTLIMEIFTY